MRHERTNWRFQLPLTSNEKLALSNQIREELRVYNTLNDRFANLVRKHPLGFIEIAKKLRLYGELVEHGYDIREVLKTLEDLPDNLQVVKEDLSMLTEEAVGILETAKIQTFLSPRTKRNMGVQMFRFYASQAPAFTSSGNYRFAPFFLENIDLLRKRHLQLHRKAVIVEFDEERNKTLIKVPYLARKLIVEGNAKKLKWDVMIVHQEPNTLVSVNTPWFIDFKRTTDDYLLQYLDNPSPYRNSSFSKSQNDYRRSKF